MSGEAPNRPTHRCHILEATGESYRLQDARRREVEKRTNVARDNGTICSEPYDGMVPQRPRQTRDGRCARPSCGPENAHDWWIGRVTVQMSR